MPSTSSDWRHANPRSKGGSDDEAARTDRCGQLREQHGLGLCNITKCCTEVCPEYIKITDNAIIPMKERVADKRYDPMGLLIPRWRNRSGRTSDRPTRSA